MIDEENIMRIASEILGYMERYPDAADTQEYVTSWWLSTRGAEQGSGPVTIALAMLERNGFIEHVELPGQRMVYRLRKDPLSPSQGGGQG